MQFTHRSHSNVKFTCTKQTTRACMKETTETYTKQTKLQVVSCCSRICQTLPSLYRRHLSLQKYTTVSVLCRLASSPPFIVPKVIDQRLSDLIHDQLLYQGPSHYRVMNRYYLVFKAYHQVMIPYHEFFDPSHLVIYLYHSISESYHLPMKPYHLIFKPYCQVPNLYHSCF